MIPIIVIMKNSDQSGILLCHKNTCKELEHDWSDSKPSQKLLRTKYRL